MGRVTNRSSADEIELDTLNSDANNDQEFDSNPRFQSIINVFAVILIGFGAGTGTCADFQRKLKNWTIIVFIQQIIFRIMIHLSFILSVMALLIRIWSSTETTFLHFYDGYDDKLRSYSLKVIILLNSLTAIFSIDSTYFFKNMRYETNRQLCDENFIQFKLIDKNALKGQSLILRLFNRILNFSCLDQYSHKVVLLSLFLVIPLINLAVFITSIISKFLNFNLSSIEISFFAINYTINMFSTLHYITICLLIQMKFIALNALIRTLIEEKQHSFKTLKDIKQW